MENVVSLPASLDSYPKPSLTVDPAVMYIDRAPGLEPADRLRVVLWRRTVEPSLGAWALPGVFVNIDESLEGAVDRAVRTKLGLEAEQSHQVFTWNVRGRDARGWVVTIAYAVNLLPSRIPSAAWRDEAPGARAVFTLRVSREEADIVSVDAVDVEGRTVPLAFDHSEILAACMRRLTLDIWRTDVAFRFLEPKFTLRALRLVFETLLGRELNKDSFRHRVITTYRLVEPTSELESAVGHRPATLYRRRDPNPND